MGTCPVCLCVRACVRACVCVSVCLSAGANLQTGASRCLTEGTYGLNDTFFTKRKKAFSLKQKVRIVINLSGPSQL